MKNFLLLSLLFAFMLRPVSAKLYSVNSMASFNSAKSKVVAKDTISWQPGTYSDISIIFDKSNIVFRAEIPGMTIFKDSSRFRIPGENNTFEGFQFVGGNCGSVDVLESRGSGNYFSNINIKDYVCSKYVSVFPNAKRNTFSYCTFENRPNINGKNIFSLTFDGISPGYHLITHCQFKNLRGQGNGADWGVEPIRLGVDGSQGGYVSRSIVEYCYFSQCNGDGEVISSKSTENIYRYNTLENNPYGTIVLRHGSKGIVYGNFVINGQGGVRVKEGHNHTIFNNYFQNLSDNSIYIQNYNIDTPDSVLIVHNTFVNAGTMLLGGTPDAGKVDAKPKHVVFANNIVTSTNKTLFSDPTGTETWISNIVNGSVGITNTSGFTQADPKLVKNSAGFYDLASNSPAIDNAKDFAREIPLFEGLNADYDIAFDVIKNLRPSDITKKDIGAQEYQAGAVVKPHATLANTGPTYLMPPAVPNGIKTTNVSSAVKIYPNPAKQSFMVENAGGNFVEVAIYNISGKLMYQSKVQTPQLMINETLKSGVYFVKIKDLNGNEFAKKLVII